MGNPRPETYYLTLMLTGGLLTSPVRTGKGWYTMGKKKQLTLRDFAMLGVKARMEKITPERRKEIATKASHSRWAKKPKGRK